MEQPLPLPSKLDGQGEGRLVLEVQGFDIPSAAQDLLGLQVRDLHLLIGTMCFDKPKLTVVIRHRHPLGLGQQGADHDATSVNSKPWRSALSRSSASASSPR